MGIYGSMILSAILLLGAAGLTFYWFISRRINAWRLASITVLVVASVSVWRFQLNAEGLSGFLLATDSLFQGMQSVGMGGDISALVKGLDKWAAFYTAFQCIAAPLICGLALAKSIIGLTISTRLGVCMRPVYFFSELTEETVILAESIRQKIGSGHGGEKALFCFSVSADDDDAYKGLPYWRRARKFGAVPLSMRIAHNLFPRWTKSITCILCSKDEKKNVKELARLLREGEKDRRRKRNQTIKYFAFVHSTQSEKDIDFLADKYKNDECRLICALDPAENMVVHILSSHPLYQYCAQDENGQKRMNVLIIGSGGLADGFLRAVYPCGQMQGCEFSVMLAAENAQEYRRELMRSAPMLAGKDNALVKECGGMEFVTLSENAAAADADLLRDKDYVFIALEEDEENALLAERISTIMNRQKLTDPRRAQQRVAIVCTVQDPDMNRLYCQRFAAKEGDAFRRCEVILAGSREKQYQVEVLLEHELLQRAFFVDQAYMGPIALPADSADAAKICDRFIGFMNNAYARRSSLACALQMGYYKHMLDASGGNMQKTVPLLMDAEHRRWGAYTMMDGYEAPTDAQISAYMYRDGEKHRSRELRLHPCLISGQNGALEVLSENLDAKILERIEEGFGQACVSAGFLRKMTGEERKKAILAAAESISDIKLREQIKKMCAALHTDYVAHDRHILECMNEIVGMPRHAEIRKLLKKFWM